MPWPLLVSLDFLLVSYPVEPVCEFAKKINSAASAYAMRGCEDQRGHKFLTKWASVRYLFAPVLSFASLGTWLITRGKKSELSWPAGTDTVPSFLLACFSHIWMANKQEIDSSLILFDWPRHLGQFSHSDATGLSKISRLNISFKSRSSGGWLEELSGTIYRANTWTGLDDVISGQEQFQQAESVEPIDFRRVPSLNYYLFCVITAGSQWWTVAVIILY